MFNQLKKKTHKTKMARCLDSNYFSLLERRVVGVFEYQAYKANDAFSTIVLFSGEEPIAAVGFVSYGRRIITHRRQREGVAFGDSGNDCFTAITSVDNGEYGFVISNLTDVVRYPDMNLDRGKFEDAGMLKIDLLTDNSVSVVDMNIPNSGINAWNELLPSQSALIRGDQRKNNRTMVLRGIVNSQGQHITVAQDAVAQHGTYVHVNVTATRNFPELTALLDRATEWRCVEVFVRRIYKGNGISVFPPSSRNQGSRGSGGLFGDSNWHINQPTEERNDQIRNQYRSSPFGSTRQRVSCFGNSQPQSQPAFGFGAPLLHNQAEEFTLPFAQMQSQYQQQQQQQQQATLFSVSGFGGPPTFDPFSPPPTQPSAFAFSNRVDITEDQQANVAQAAETVTGDGVISMNIRSTQLQYSRKAATRATLCLAVWLDLPALNELSFTEATQLGKAMIADYVAETLTSQISKVYASSECVICMDALPSQILIRCGHLCLCQNCDAASLRSCPLCRARIIGHVDFRRINV